MPTRHVTIQGVMTWDDAPPGVWPGPSPTPPPGRPPATVLQPADFTYLGCAPLPLDDAAAGTRFGYSTGALSGRVVDGATHLFITQATQETGWPDPVAEVRWAGVGQRMTLVINHGDITQGRRVSAAGNPKPIRGLLWDPVSQQLLWSYMDAYNVTCQQDPSLGASRLNPVAAAGPWRLADGSQHTGGYLYAIPPASQAACRGHGFVAGAPIGSGDAGSPFGAYGAAFTLPPPETPPDTTHDGGHVTIPTLSLLYSDITHRQARPADVDECGWQYYGQPNAFGHEPQWNPVQNGTGCTVDGDLCGCSHGPIGIFTHVDRLNAAAWITGPTKHGVVYIGQLARTLAAHAADYGASGRCHVWYGPPQEHGSKKLCAHGQNDTRYGHLSTGPGVTTLASTLYIYDPAVLLAVAGGTASPIGVVPTTDAYDLSQITAVGAAFPQLTTAANQYGGAWWEPRSRLLFVSATASEWSGEWRPIVHAFAVAA